MKDCPACQVEEYVEARLREEGLDVADFDVTDIGKRLLDPAHCGYTPREIIAGEMPAMKFWRAVYGPAYPAAVTS